MKNKFTATVFDKQEKRRKVISQPSEDFKYLRKQIKAFTQEKQDRYCDPKLKLELNLEK